MYSCQQCRTGTPSCKYEFELNFKKLELRILKRLDLLSDNTDRTTEKCCNPQNIKAVCVSVLKSPLHSVGKHAAAISVSWESVCQILNFNLKFPQIYHATNEEK